MSEKVAVIVRKEVLENLRSLRYWGLIVLFVLLFVAISAAISAAMGSAFQGREVPAPERGRPATRGVAELRLVVQFVGSLSAAMSFVAPLLGIALGFSAIVAEREKGTIRLVLARPVYRDQVLNGKILAATILIAIAVFVSTALSLPISATLYGVTLTADDLSRLMLSLIPSILLALAYYALSLFISVLSDRSGRALLYCILAWIFLTFVLPIAASMIAYSVLGPPPAIALNRTSATGVEIGVTVTVADELPPQLQDYYRKLGEITSSVLMISPNDRYFTLVNALFTRRSPQTTSYVDLGSIIATRWVDLAVLAAYVAVFTLLSYIFFVQRQEVR
ncbi:MAG: ABC transporter permease [Thermofilum sp.]|nr:ABC transporter permease [Thermofilum sp.]